MKIKKELIDICVTNENALNKEIAFEIQGLKSALNGGGYTLNSKTMLIIDKAKYLESLITERDRNSNFKQELFKKTDFYKAFMDFLGEAPKS